MQVEDSEEELRRVRELEQKIVEVEIERKREEILHRRYSAQLYKLNQRLSSLVSKLKATEKALSGTRSELARAGASYEKLAKSKLGSLTLAYWRLKDGFKRKLRKRKKPSLKSAKTRFCKDVGTAFVERMKAKVAGMPVSNGCRFYTRLDARIGIICDQFYWDAVCNAANFVPISPGVPDETLASLDCLLVVTAWRGLKDDEWKGIANENTPRRREAERIIDVCRSKTVPVAFYSKEDPPNYELYLELAKKCDVVFTSAAECVPDYCRDCGHDNVHVMKFCINPVVHNPVGMRFAEKERNVIFSGSWMEKYPHRCHDLSVIFDGILASGRGLNIIDRNYELRRNPMYRYPDRYAGFLSPAVEHGDLQKIHRLFDWAVNINTVKDSLTMFANRVYELQACGSLLLSNYSVGVSNLLPTVFFVHDSAEVPRILNSFTDEEVYERQVSGVRRVMTGESCFDRISELLKVVGIDAPVPKRRVLVIGDSRDDGVREAFARQSYPDRKLLSPQEVTEVEYRQADIIAFFGRGIDYGDFYLEDMVNAFKYTDCDYVTKNAYLKKGRLVRGKEHDYVSEILGKEMTVFWRSSFEFRTLMCLRGRASIPNGYAVDHFGLEICPVRPKAAAPKLSVILPIFNNGWFLYGRSFASLRRSSLFAEMEVILVDDGSTDGFTPQMIRHLERRYPNVKARLLEGGGSGSAARPRNVALAELATADHVAFLDPDDEAVNDAYARLYDKVVAEGLDFAIFNVNLIRDKITTTDNYAHFVAAVEKPDAEGGKSFLQKSAFRPCNIQAAVIRRRLLAGLTQVVGAGGEDSFFYQQMLCRARRVAAVPLTGMIYYAERADSVANSVDASFFAKYAKVERERVKWLTTENLIADYMAMRHAGYVTGWYFRKLAMVADAEERKKAVAVIRGALELYRDHYDGRCEAINDFLACRNEAEVMLFLDGMGWQPRDRAKEGYFRRQVLLSEPQICIASREKSYVGSVGIRGVEIVTFVGKLKADVGESVFERAALLRLEFRDGKDAAIKTVVLPSAPDVGNYLYLTAGKGGFHPFVNRVKVPPGAVSMAYGFMQWGAQKPLTLESFEITALVRNA